MSADESQVKGFLLCLYSPVTCRLQLFSALADSLNGLSLRLAGFFTLPVFLRAACQGRPFPPGVWGCGVFSQWLLLLPSPPAQWVLPCLRLAAPCLCPCLGSNFPGAPEPLVSPDLALRAFHLVTAPLRKGCLLSGSVSASQKPGFQWTQA